MCVCVVSNVLCVFIELDFKCSADYLGSFFFCQDIESGADHLGSIFLYPTKR